MIHSTGKDARPYAGNRKNRRYERGSASVEFAAVLPLVAIAMLAVVQVSLIVWDQMRVVHAAREGARVLAVTNEPGAAKDAAVRAGDLDASRTTVESGPGERPAGTPAFVSVRYRPRVVVPYVGRFMPDFELAADAWIRVERDPP